jgi:hypothetical protein
LKDFPTRYFWNAEMGVNTDFIHKSCHFIKTNCIRHKKAKIPRNTANFASNILDREFTAPTPNSKWVSDSDP